MSRNKALSVLQKTYDDTYLSCSTAVYHESQGNEIESMRHWKGALEQIYDYNANKALPAYVPRSDTEKALSDALKELELQCKERIDLLEALRVSRQEESTPTQSSNKLSKAPEPYDPGNRSPGGLGQGTIPAITYAELSRPSLLPRPPLPERTSSEAAVVGGSHSNGGFGANTASIAIPPSPDSQQREGRPRRSSPSPEKHTMRTTLRFGKSSERPAKPSRKTRPAAEGPSKAATLAWTALGSRERAARASPSETSPGVKNSSPRRSTEQQRRPGVSSLQWDSHSRRLVTPRPGDRNANGGDPSRTPRHSEELFRPSQLSVSAASSALNSSSNVDVAAGDATIGKANNRLTAVASAPPRAGKGDNGSDSTGIEESPDTPEKGSASDHRPKRKPVPRRKPAALRTAPVEPEIANRSRRRERRSSPAQASSSTEDEGGRRVRGNRRVKAREPVVIDDPPAKSPSLSSDDQAADHDRKHETAEESAWKKRKASVMKDLPPGVDESAAKQILNDIIVEGDEVRWSDIAGLDIAKAALREAVVYPFLRPDLFMGLREPTRGMLLFGPPGTGKTMLARAVATESRSTFFSISASSLTSKFLGESEKLVRALFGLARALAPSIIFVDEIDSLLSQRSGSGEHEATRRIKTEFLIQWSDLQRAAAGRETTEKDRERGDANRVLVLAATNLPWAIDEAARRRFVRRQYIPLPEPTTRETQLRTLLGQQKHHLTDADILQLVKMTDGFSGSDITALAKDAAMGPLRSLGEALLHMTMDEIRPIMLVDFEASLKTIRPSVSKAGLKEYEDWATEFGERGG
ncbi:ATPase family associated with various cellular activities (AAA) domain-containing protein [Sarocladium implicatum]|nr:ATPase family associated with various cellular activities (AAA) domain-containing protein [Sarocladium implicatum]